MRRYQVGDKVRVKTLKELAEIGRVEGSSINHGADNSFVEDMNKFCGKIVTIVSVHRCNSYCIAEDDEGWCFDEWMLDNKFDLSEWMLEDESDISLDTPVMVFNDVYESDMVNHPQHYTECSLECIQVMILIFGAKKVAYWCAITSFKYLWRFKNKNGEEDLKKAYWYLDKVRELNEPLDVQLQVMEIRLRLLLDEVK